jgi:hypothetical protein
MGLPVAAVTRGLDPEFTPALRLLVLGPPFAR